MACLLGIFQFNHWHTVTQSQEHDVSDAPLRRSTPALLVCALALVAGGVLPHAAHADIFGAEKAAPVVDARTKLRIDELEKAVQALTAGTGITVQPGAIAAPGAAAAPAEPPALVKSYRVVGHVNGRSLVRAGEKRFLLTDEELAEFDQRETERVQAQEKAGSSTALLELPDPMAAPKPPPQPQVIAKLPERKVATAPLTGSGKPRDASGKNKTPVTSKEAN